MYHGQTSAAVDPAVAPDEEWRSIEASGLFPTGYRTIPRAGAANMSCWGAFVTGDGYAPMDPNGYGIECIAGCRKP